MDIKDTSFEEWIFKVKKELKIDDLSVKNVKIDSQLSTDPFFERIPKQINGYRKEKSWKIREVFDAKENDNSDLLKALSGGVNSIEIENADLIQNPSAFFKDIHLDFINLHLNYNPANSENQADSMIEFLQRQLSQKKISVRMCGMHQKAAKIWLAHRFSFQKDEEITEGLVRICNEIIALIDQAENRDHAVNIASKIEIIRDISSNIIQEIALKKAIENIWFQVCEGFEMKMAVPLLLANCTPNMDLELESKYIDQSVKGLTAAIAAYDSIYIAPADQDKYDFHARISRNIHHLLLEESFVQKADKAYVGSSQIENIATEIAVNVWKNIGRV